MTEKVNFDNSLLSALEKAEERIIKEFLLHEMNGKYKKRFKFAIGNQNLKRYFKMLLKITKSEEFPFQYKLIFTDYYGKSVEIVSKSKEFDQKKFREDFCDSIRFAFNYQNQNCRP